MIESLRNSLSKIVKSVSNKKLSNKKLNYDPDEEYLPYDSIDSLDSKYFLL